MVRFCLTFRLPYVKHVGRRPQNTSCKVLHPEDWPARPRYGNEPWPTSGNRHLDNCLFTFSPLSTRQVRMEPIKKVEILFPPRHMGKLERFPRAIWPCERKDAWNGKDMRCSLPEDTQNKGNNKTHIRRNLPARGYPFWELLSFHLEKKYPAGWELLF